MVIKIFVNIIIISLLTSIISRAYAIEELFYKGIEQYRQENYEEALEIFKQIYKTNPSTIVSFYLGLTYKQTGDYKTAKDYFYNALNRTPQIKDAYIEIAEVLYFLDELNEAIKWLNEAERESIMLSKVFFLKGLILSKIGRFDEARKSFEKAKSIEPGLTQASDLQIALSYSAEKKIKEATKTLEELIKTEPSTDIAEFASYYLNTLKRTFKEWNITLSLGYQYDDNVVSKPTTLIGISAVDEISGKTDSAYIKNIKLSWRPLLLGNLFFGGDFSIHSKNYFSSHRFDTTFSTVGFNLGIHHEKASITLPLNYSHMWLDKKEYMCVFSLTPTVNLQPISGHIFQFSTGYGKREMLKYTTNADPDEDRDSDQYSISFGYSYVFKEKGVFFSKYEYMIDNTQGINWDSYSNKVSSAVVYPITERFLIYITGDYTSQKYKNINTYTGRSVKGFPHNAEKRNDRIYSATVGIIFEISNTMKTNISYYHLRTDSNFPIYDYKRNIYSVEMSFNF